MGVTVYYEWRLIRRRRRRPPAWAVWFFVLCLAFFFCAFPTLVLVLEEVLRRVKDGNL